MPYTKKKYANVIKHIKTVVFIIKDYCRIQMLKNIPRYSKFQDIFFFFLQKRLSKEVLIIWSKNRKLWLQDLQVWRLNKGSSKKNRYCLGQNQENIRKICTGYNRAVLRQLKS